MNYRTSITNHIPTIKKKLGTKFNIASFHDEILSQGCLPLSVLEKKMALWLILKNKIIIKNLALLILFCGSLCAQEKCDVQKSAEYQQELNREYSNKKTSPLTAADLKEFKKLDFFKVNSDYCVIAKIKRTINATPFAMQTTTDRSPMYVKYADLSFLIDGKEQILEVYQSIKPAAIQAFSTDLFLPFTDLTSDEESYSGGRYMDLQIPDGDFITIDFNRAYNPYCAYNSRYSCPLVPKVNHLEVKINAGVKKFHN